MPDTIATQLHFWADVKGERTFLKPPKDALAAKREDKREMNLSPVDRKFRELVKALEHEQLLSFRFRKSGHINILENFTISTLVKYLSKDPIN
jgi:hypothetical protein